MDSVESPFRIAVYREKNRYIDAQAEEAKSNHGLSDALFNDHMGNMEKIFETYERRMMILVSNEITMAYKSRSPGLETKLESKIEFYFRKWFAEFGAARARATATTTRDDIRKALLAVNDMPESVAEVPTFTRILRARGLSAWRADTIARTETHNAAMEASVKTAEDISGETGLILFKEWVPVQDGRTRDAHAAMDMSKPIPVGEKFNVGGEYLDRPGQGSAGNSINCRCVLVYSSE